MILVLSDPILCSAMLTKHCLWGKDTPGSSHSYPSVHAERQLICLMLALPMKNEIVRTPDISYMACPKTVISRHAWGSFICWDNLPRMSRKVSFPADWREDLVIFPEGISSWLIRKTSFKPQL